MMRVALIIPTLDQSGAERQLTLLAQGLAGAGSDVAVIALSRGGPLARELESSGVSVDVLGKRFRFDPLTILKLRTALKRFRPEICQSFLFAANSYLRLPGVVPAKSRIIVSERCVDSWKSSWQLCMDRLLVRRMDQMTANSESVADFYRNTVGVPREKLTVIPNAVVMRQPDYSREQALQKLGLKSEHRVIGFSGRLAPQKRLHDVIWAFQLLHQVADHVRLVLIGDGPERSALAELARRMGCRDKVVFAEHRHDAFSLLSAIDVFTLASEFEGMSNSLMEAMSLGIPCVASDIAPNRELITHRESGLLFPCGDAPMLTKAWIDVLNNPDLGVSLGNAAKQRIQTHHQLSSLVERHLELYRRLLQPSPI